MTICGQWVTVDHGDEGRRDAATPSTLASLIHASNIDGRRASHNPPK
jgi:hypothetical protein